MPSCWCLYHTMQTLPSSVTEYVPRNLCLSIPQSYQGFWKMLKCPVYIGKNGLFLVGGKRKSGLLLCKIHWQSSTLSLGYFQGHLLPSQLSWRNWKPAGEEKYHDRKWERADSKDLGKTKGRSTEIELNHCFKRVSTNEGEKTALCFWEVWTYFSVLIREGTNLNVKILS